MDNVRLSTTLETLKSIASGNDPSTNAIKKKIDDAVPLEAEDYPAMICTSMIGDTKKKRKKAYTRCKILYTGTAVPEGYRHTVGISFYRHDVSLTIDACCSFVFYTDTAAQVPSNLQKCTHTCTTHSIFAMAHRHHHQTFSRYNNVDKGSSRLGTRCC